MKQKITIWTPFYNNSTLQWQAEIVSQFFNKIWRYMKLLRATQLHMAWLEIVLYYFAYIYEIRSYSLLILIKYMKLCRIWHNFQEIELQI